MIHPCVYVPPTEQELNEKIRWAKEGYEIKNNRELSAFLLSQGYVKNIQGLTLKTLDLLTQKIPREVKEAVSL